MNIKGIQHPHRDMMIMMSHIAKWIGAAAVIFFFVFAPQAVIAQELHEDLQGVWKARVTAILDERTQVIPGTDTPQLIQQIEVEILDGERAGERVEMKNDFISLAVGQRIYMNYLVTVGGSEMFSVRDIDRRLSIGLLVAAFALVVVWFGRLQGVRSLISLAGSLLVIVYVLLPLLIRGYNPVLMSVLIGILILFVAIFFTHGFNRRSLVAFSGTTIAVILTGVMAFVSIKMLRLSGFFSDETVYLHFSTSGALNFEGLLLGGIIIGVLGVLDDIAISQVAMVKELSETNPNAKPQELYQRALRVGREHVGALVNTIVLAYAGVSLPLLLWFSQSAATFGTIINNEVFATEIARTVVGSIGLILTVPITTYIAVRFVEHFERGEGHHHHHH